MKRKKNIQLYIGLGILAVLGVFLVLGLIYVICLFTGTLSVRNVLRKTPAEIMAKYDI